MTSDSLQKTTSLKVFSIDDLHTCLAEKHLGEVWRLLCIFPDGSILLNGREFQPEKTLLKLCPKTLDTLISQQWEGAFTAAVIDNDSFCIIKPADSQLGKGKRQRVISTYTLNTDSYVCASTTQLTHHPKSRFGDMDWVQLLRKNRFCCGIRENNTNEFKILIFEINLATHAVTELGIIQPAEQYFNYFSRGSGSFKVLPNGNILTQHAGRTGVRRGRRRIQLQLVAGRGGAADLARTSRRRPEALGRERHRWHIDPDHQPIPGGAELAAGRPIGIARC